MINYKIKLNDLEELTQKIKREIKDQDTKITLLLNSLRNSIELFKEVQNKLEQKIKENDEPIMSRFENLFEELSDKLSKIDFTQDDNWIERQYIFFSWLLPIFVLSISKLFRRLIFAPVSK